MNLWRLRVIGKDPLTEMSKVELSLVGVIGVERKDHNCDKLELIVFIYSGLVHSFPRSTAMNHDSQDRIQRLELTDIIFERASTNRPQSGTGPVIHSMYLGKAPNFGSENRISSFRNSI